MSGLSALSNEDQIRLLALLKAEDHYRSGRRIDTLYPSEGEYSRDKYPKHMEFFQAGKEYRERCFMAANRVGKTWGGGGYETALHLTGQYPDWWEGRVFDKPVRWWAAGKTNETTRDIVQTTLLGDVTGDKQDKHFTGTGLIPRDAINSITWKAGVPNLADTIKVKHISGGYSLLGIKSYQQGRGSFEGTAQHGIWLDEEPPEEIYGECLIRTATTNGILMITFTPLEGMTGTVMSFLPQEYAMT